MLTKAEMETTIRFDRETNECIIFTADKTVMTKLDKLYRCVRVDDCGGDISKTYATDKHLISFRSDPKYKPVHVAKRTLSADHVTKMQEARKNKQGIAG
jgi:hypothetical protein